MSVLKFSGGPLVATGVAVFWAIADRGNGYSADPPNNNPDGYPVPAGTARRLRVRVNTNTFTDIATVFVLKNGAPTAITLTIPAAATGGFDDLVNSAVFAAGDRLTLVVTVPSGLGSMQMSATLEFATS